MILRVLKSNRSVNYFLFPMLGILFWLNTLLNPQAYAFFKGENENILYAPISQWLGGYLFLQDALALLLLIVLAFLVQQVNNRYNFIRIRTILPAPLFVIIISGFTKMHTLHPVYFAAIFLVLAIYRFFSAFDKVKPYSAAFDTGFLLGLASLFYFNISILFPAFFIGIGILSREYQWRQYVLILLGFLLPILFALGYGVFTDNFLELLKTFERNILTPNNHFKSNIALNVFMGYLAILTIIGSIKIIQQYDRKKVSTRKYFSVFFLIFVFSLVSFFFIPATSQEMLVITTIPLTFLISNFFVFLKSLFCGELLFSLLFVIVLVLQFLASSYYG